VSPRRADVLTRSTSVTREQVAAGLVAGLAIPIGALATVSPTMAVAAVIAVMFVATTVADLAAGLAVFTTVTFFVLIPGVGVSFVSVVKVAGAALLLSLARMKGRPSLLRDHPLFASVALALGAWAFASALWAPDVSQARAQAFTLALSLLLVFIVYAAIRKPQHARWLVRGYVAGAVLSALVGLVVAAPQETGGTRLSGGIGDPNELALVLVPGLALSFFAIPGSRGAIEHWLLVASAGVMAISLFETGSRGGLVALVVAFAAGVIFGGSRRGTRNFLLRPGRAGGRSGARPPLHIWWREWPHRHLGHCRSGRRRPSDPRRRHRELREGRAVLREPNDESVRRRSRHRQPPRRPQQLPRAARRARNRRAGVLPRFRRRCRRSRMASRPRVRALRRYGSGADRARPARRPQWNARGVDLPLGRVREAALAASRLRLGAREPGCRDCGRAPPPRGRRPADRSRSRSSRWSRWPLTAFRGGRRTCAQAHRHSFSTRSRTASACRFSCSTRSAADSDGGRSRRSPRTRRSRDRLRPCSSSSLTARIGRRWPPVVRSRAPATPSPSQRGADPPRPTRHAPARRGCTSPDR